MAEKPQISARDAAREHLVKAKIYWFIAIVLFVVGFFAAAILYAEFTRSGVMALLKNPVLIVAIFLPFAPAAFFLWLSTFHSESLYKKLNQIEADKAKSGGAAEKKP
jgi:FtsH-binding integral membrane protein